MSRAKPKRVSKKFAETMKSIKDDIERHYGFRPSDSQASNIIASRIRGEKFIDVHKGRTRKKKRIFFK